MCGNGAFMSSHETPEWCTSVSLTAEGLHHGWLGIHQHAPLQGVMREGAEEGLGSGVSVVWAPEALVVCDSRFGSK